MNKKTVKNINSRDMEDLDDCPICQAMKNGEANTMSGLMKAFQKAEKSGAGVTKILIDENKSK